MLDEHGPLTLSDMVGISGADKYVLAASLHRMSRDLPSLPKRVYVSGWVYEADGARRYPRAVYEIGGLPNVKKPKRDTNARRREMYKDNARGRITSVFDLGISLRKLNDRKLPLESV